MRISFHGAAQTVTGSQHLIEVNDKRILLDCGLYQGRRKESRERNKNFPFDPKSIDALILSHAHIDHSGNIPNLVKQGFNGDILCTLATRDLCVNMLQDSGHIHERDADFYNRKIKKKDEDPIEPLYTVQDALNSLSLFNPLPYYRQHEIFQEIELNFLDAGHMLGSSIVCMRVHDSDNNREVNFVFTGDLGRQDSPILRDPDRVEHVDVLLMESTYGDRKHPTPVELDHDLERIINNTHRRGGALIIPSFAVGRTQQLVYAMQKLTAEQRIPRLPIFVDSPLAIDVTATFRNHPEVYDQEIRDYMFNFADDDPFGFSNLQYTRPVEESKKLNSMKEPFVVISASGMMESGRILHHLRNRISDPRNTILIVGWQAPHTLGRRIQEGQETVRIFGREHELKAEVVTITGLSGHADADELVNWVDAMKKKPRQTFLVHGEQEPAAALARRLRQEIELEEVAIPELYSSVQL